MANPNNAIGTNGALGGRTSPNALNDVLATFDGSGVLSGWTLTPNSGMTITVGGTSSLRDVAIAQDNNGNKVTVDNISQAPVELEIAAAPSTNSRIDAVVAYVDNPPQGSATIVDNPAAVGLLDVTGTTASSPSEPSDSAIRSAITSAGADGSTAYYVVLGYVTIAAGTTDITADMITQSSTATLTSDVIATGSITSDKIESRSITADKIYNSTVQNGTWTSPFTAYDGSTPPRYRKVGQVVEVWGEATVTASTPSSNFVTMYTLPSNYRPVVNINCGVMQGTGVAAWTLRIAANGAVQCSRYRRNTDSAVINIEPGNWLPFYANFLVTS